MFIPENLTNLRHLFGYSQGTLSELTGIAERTIWQYENGYEVPELNEVNQLKAIFHVKSGYFYQSDLLSNKAPVVDPMHLSIRRPE